MRFPASRPAPRRTLAAGACLAALALGPAAGVASADDASIVRAVADRGGQLVDRTAAVDATTKAFRRSPSGARARTGTRQAKALARLASTFRDELRDDDGSTQRGRDVRDALLGPLGRIASSAAALQRAYARASSGAVSTGEVAGVAAAQRTFDRLVVAAGRAAAKAAG
jgi:hypothetical protein